jgi:hypothetical protein
MASILLLCTRHFLHRIEVTVRKKVLKKQRNIFFSTWAHGVVVSHPLSMREALGSIPSASILSGGIAQCVERLAAD